MIIGLHHAQITVSKTEETAARDFYCGVLGLAEIAKPDALAARGGFWVQAGDQQVHIAVEEGVDRRATKAHLAYLVNDIDAARVLMEQQGVVLAESVPLPGYERFEFRDPFGNRVEFIQAVG